MGARLNFDFSDGGCGLLPARNEEPWVACARPEFLFLRRYTGSFS
jgi:hypothetical protein